MANYIPKIQWNDQSVLGNTSAGSPVISSVLSTALIEVGMVTTSARFPVGTTVLSKTPNTITMSRNATSNQTQLATGFYHEIEFVYPVNGRPSEDFEPNQNISVSISGQRQIQTNHILAKLRLTFRFIEPSVYRKMKDVFYLPWAALGKEFRFFESKDEAAFFNYELDRLAFGPDREVAKAGDFLYKFDLTLRRIV